MKWSALKYLSAYILPLTVAVSFTQNNWLSFLPLVYCFGIIPLIELWVGPKNNNLSALENELMATDAIYDWLLYFMVPLQYAFIIWYAFAVSDLAALSFTFWGRTVSLGLMCGVLGINVGHELGHRVKRWEQNLAKALLASSLYSHFFIEHNYGHHKHVATPNDPASARYHEPLYFFWFRSVWYSYGHAWQIQRQLLKSKKAHFLSFKNQMLWFQIIHLFLLGALLLAFGLKVMFGYLAAAVLGIFLLETVNYIEHYGLQREKVNAHRYENTNPAHSWNSNHLIGRLVLFELSRHSDHHANPHKKFQVLKSYAESPQLPTGYPGMIILSLVPPLWFKVMNPRIKALSAKF